MPPGTLVPRDWVLDRLSEDIRRVATVETPAPPARVDLTIRELAQLFGKQRSTVRAWVERGDFPAAYKWKRFRTASGGRRPTPDSQHGGR